MKTIRLLYPDHRSGGLDTYYFGANLLQHILPRNDNQPLVKVDIAPPDGKGRDAHQRALEAITAVSIHAPARGATFSQRRSMP